MPDKTMTLEDIKSKLKIALVFHVEDDQLAAAILPMFPDDLTDEEQYKAENIVCFVHGLLAETRNNFQYFRNKGLEILKDEAEENQETEAQLALDLEHMKVVGQA